MLSYTDSLAIVLEQKLELKSETVPIREAAGRILAASFQSRVDLPPFLTSSVDGYAVILPVGETLPVTSEFPAGFQGLVRELVAGEAVRVFTGSRLPPNCEAVLMNEDTDLDGSLIRLTTMPCLGENLRRRGEELTKGQELGEIGQPITPPLLALAAGSGNSELRVFKKPRVSIVEIGSELTEPGELLRDSSIYAANGLALAQACQVLGADVRLFRCSDDYEEIGRTFDAASSNAYIVLTSGGVSVGKYDHVKEIWRSKQAKEIFWRVAIRPGKPLYFASLGKTLIFGLPGNPVSTLVTFFLYVRPLLLASMNRLSDRWIKVKTSMPLEALPHLDVFTRVALKDGVATSLRNQGSHMLTGLSSADALLKLPRGVGSVPAGSVLQALHLDWII